MNVTDVCCVVPHIAACRDVADRARVGPNGGAGRFSRRGRGLPDPVGDAVRVAGARQDRLCLGACDDNAGRGVGHGLPVCVVDRCPEDDGIPPGKQACGDRFVVLFTYFPVTRLATPAVCCGTVACTFTFTVSVRTPDAVDAWTSMVCSPAARAEAFQEASQRWG